MSKSPTGDSLAPTTLEGEEEEIELPPPSHRHARGAAMALGIGAAMVLALAAYGSAWESSGQPATLEPTLAMEPRLTAMRVTAFQQDVTPSEEEAPDVIVVMTVDDESRQLSSIKPKGLMTVMVHGPPCEVWIDGRHVGSGTKLRVSIAIGDHHVSCMRTTDRSHAVVRVGALEPAWAVFDQPL